MVQKLSMTNLTGDSLTVGNTVITGTGVTVNDEPLSGGTGGAEVYANTTFFPTSGLTPGSFAFANNNNTLFMTNGSGWYKIALVNQTPSITASIESALMGKSGNTIMFTYSVSDPDGMTPTVTVANSGFADSSVGNVVLYTANNTVEVNNFSAQPYSATITLTGSDGISFDTDTVTIQVTFSPDPFWVKDTYGIPDYAHLTEDEHLYWLNSSSEVNFSAGADTNVNVTLVHKIDGELAEYAWTTYLQADMSSYNSSHDAHRVASSNNQPIAVGQFPHVIGGSIRYSPMFWRMDSNSGAPLKAVAIPYGFYRPYPPFSAGSSSVASGGNWFAGGSNGGTNTICIARSPHNMYTSGDTINSGNTNFYKAHSMSGWGSGGTAVDGACELSDGSIITIGNSWVTSGAPNYYFGYTAYVLKFNNDGTYNSSQSYKNNPYAGTSYTNGFLPKMIKQATNGNILMVGYDANSSSSYRPSAQLVLFNSSMTVLYKRQIYPNGKSGTTSVWSPNLIEVADDGDFVVIFHNTQYDQFAIGKFDSSDLTDSGVPYICGSGITTAGIPGTSSKAGKFVFSVDRGTNEFTHTGTLDSWPLENLSDIFGSATATTWVDSGTSTFTASKGSGPSMSQSTYTPEDVYGNHSTSYGGDQNYFNVITTDYNYAFDVTSNTDFTQL